jgi:hypothetical protein
LLPATLCLTAGARESNSSCRCLPRRSFAAEQREDGSRTQAGQSLPGGLISAGVKTICRAMDGPLEEVCIYDRMDTDKHGFSISDRRPLPSSFSISAFQFSSAREMPRLFFYFTGQLSWPVRPGLLAFIFPRQA